MPTEDSDQCDFGVGCSVQGEETMEEEVESPGVDERSASGRIVELPVVRRTSVGVGLAWPTAMPGPPRAPSESNALDESLVFESVNINPASH